MSLINKRRGLDALIAYQNKTASGGLGKASEPGAKLPGPHPGDQFVAAVLEKCRKNAGAGKGIHLSNAELQVLCHVISAGRAV